MRSYHPDRNRSAEAAARARAITEAYKTIGDPASRAEYDARRTAHIYEILGYEHDVERPRRRWLKAPDIHLPKMPVIQWPRMPVIAWPKMPAIPWPRVPAIPWPKAPGIGVAAASVLAI